MDEGATTVSAMISPVIEAAEEKGATKVLISHEGLSLLSTDHISELLKGIGLPVRQVILFLRNIYEQALSITSESNKKGWALPIRAEHKKRYERTLNYPAIVQNWADSVGQDAITVHAYSGRHSSIQNTFISALGLINPSEGFFRRNRPNVSLLMPLQAVLGYTNILDGSESYRAVSRLIADIERPIGLFPAEVDLAKIIKQRYAAPLDHELLTPHSDRLLAEPLTVDTLEHKRAMLQYVAKCCERISNAIEAGEL